MSNAPTPHTCKLQVNTLAELATLPVQNLCTYDTANGAALPPLSPKSGAVAYVLAEDNGSGPYFKLMPMSLVAFGGNVKAAQTCLDDPLDATTGNALKQGRWVRLATIDHA